MSPTTRRKEVGTNIVFPSEFLLTGKGGLFNVTKNPIKKIQRTSLSSNSTETQKRPNPRINFGNLMTMKGSNTICTYMWFWTSNQELYS